MVSFCGISVLFADSFTFFVASSLVSCTAISSSSILRKSNSASPITWPAGRRNSCVPTMSQESCPSPVPRPSIFLSFPAVKGKKGSHKTARAAAIWRATNMMALTRSPSCFITFQGSSPARYWLPSRARFISSWLPSRKRYLEIESASVVGKALIASRVSLSVALSSEGDGTLPS